MEHKLRLKQSVQNFGRYRTSKHPEYTDGNCQCGRKFANLYYIWVSSKDGRRLCTFCFAGYLDDGDVYEGKDGPVKNRAVDQSLNRLLSTWEPGHNVDLDVECRLELDGKMDQCKGCVRDCNVPWSPNVSMFYCADRRLEA